MEKQKKTPKVVDILKEEKQAFGILVRKYTSARKAHSYPLTSVPLVLAAEEHDLRQDSKAALWNRIIAEPGTVGEEAPIRADWIL